MQCCIDFVHLSAEAWSVVCGRVIQLLEQSINRGAHSGMRAALFFITDKQTVQGHRSLLSRTRILIGDAVSLGGNFLQQPASALFIEFGLVDLGYKGCSKLTGALRPLANPFSRPSLFASSLLNVFPPVPNLLP